MNNCLNDKRNDKIANITNSLEDFLEHLVDAKFVLIKQCFSNVSLLIKNDDVLFNGK